MAQRGSAPWWAVIVSGLCGALLAGLVAALVVRGDRPDPDPVPDAVAEPTATPTDVPEETPVVTFIGDSWTEGIGATALRGYAEITADRLGWEVHVLGVGGSGYTQPGRGSTFDQRVERAVATDPDVLVVQGSINDRQSAPGALGEAALRTLGHLRAAVDADTVVLVLGASYTPGTDREVVDGLNDTVGAMAERAGFRFVDPATGNWNDPEVPGIWADANHPNDTGHQVLAARLAPVLEPLAQR